MTNYNEKLDEILYSLCDLSYASFTTQEEADRVADQLDYDRAKAKQAITSLIVQAFKELKEKAVTPPCYVELKVVTLRAIDNKIKELEEV